MAAMAPSSLFLGSPTFLFFSHKPPSLKFHVLLPLPSPISSKPPLSSRVLRFQLFSAVREVSVEEKSLEGKQKEDPDGKFPRIYLANLPWDFTDLDIKNLFSQCGTVEDVQLMKQKNGRSRGFGFVTMSSWEEAEASVDKFSSLELQGRVIRVEIAKTIKKPPPPPPTPSEGATVGETRNKLYVSNLAWKVRSSHLRDFFAASYKPLSTRVVFESPSGRSAGYGFVSFSTKEEAEAAISTLDGKELMGRPIRLKLSEGQVNESSSEPEQADDSQR